MPYEPTRWVDNETPINELNLNKIENQLVKNTDEIEKNQFETTENTKNIQATQKDIKKLDKNAIKTIDDLGSVTEEGAYKYNGELYIAKSVEWDTDLSKPFKYIGEGAIPELDFNQGDIDIEGGNGVVPLLKYANRWANHDGGTYIFLSADNESFDVYVSDIAENPASFVDTYGFVGGDTVDLSSLITEQYTHGLGEDIYGNWAKIKQYFISTNFDMQKLLTEADKESIGGGSLTAKIENDILVVSSQGTSVRAEIQDGILILK